MNTAWAATATAFTTVRVDGHPVRIRLGHREEPGRSRWSAIGDPVVTVTAPVPLTLHEVAAVLFGGFLFQGPDVAMAELADDERVRALVAERVVNGGCRQLDEDVFTAETTSDAHRWRYCYQRAREVFASPTSGAGPGLARAQRAPAGLDESGVGVTR